ncbi:N-acetyl-1-D-myo-inositol-2-amino-2-deoxy-alpha-D-glucopyranoside deacetylase [Nakamurella sp. GG22]
MSRSLLAVHAHPDDESLTMAGTLAGAVAGGHRVTLVTATLGEQGEVIGDELQGLVADRADQLGGYRLTELRAACAALGIVDHRFLGGVGTFRDSGMAGTPSIRHPRAFARASPGGPDHDRAVGLLSAVIDDVRPDVLLTYDADGGYGHPDHVATHQVSLAAVSAAGWRVRRVLAVVRPRTATVAAFETFSAAEPPEGYLRAAAADTGFLAEDDAVAFAVPVAGSEAARAAALAAHATQVELIPGGFALSNRIAQPLLDVECFRLLAGEPPPAGGRSADVFAGLG